MRECFRGRSVNEDGVWSGLYACWWCEAPVCGEAGSERLGSIAPHADCDASSRHEDPSRLRKNATLGVIASEISKRIAENHDDVRASRSEGEMLCFSNDEADMRPRLELSSGVADCRGICIQADSAGNAAGDGLDGSPVAAAKIEQTVVFANELQEILCFSPGEYPHRRSRIAQFSLEPYAPTPMG